MSRNLELSGFDPTSRGQNPSKSFFVVRADTDPVNGFQIRVGIDKLDINNYSFLRSDLSEVTIVNCTNHFSGDVVFLSEKQHRYGDISFSSRWGITKVLGIAPGGTITIYNTVCQSGLPRLLTVSGDVMIESISRSHPVRSATHADFQRLVQSAQDHDAELTTQFEQLVKSVRENDAKRMRTIEHLSKTIDHVCAQNKTLFDEVRRLNGLIEEMQIKNARTETMFTSQFEGLCDMIEDVIDQNTSLKITKDFISRNPFDEM